MNALDRRDLSAEPITGNSQQFTESKDPGDDIVSPADGAKMGAVFIFLAFVYLAIAVVFPLLVRL